MNAVQVNLFTESVQVVSKAFFLHLLKVKSTPVNWSKFTLLIRLKVDILPASEYQATFSSHVCVSKFLTGVLNLTGSVHLVDIFFASLTKYQARSSSPVCVSK